MRRAREKTEIPPSPFPPSPYLVEGTGVRADRRWGLTKKLFSFLIEMTINIIKMVESRANRFILGGRCGGRVARHAQRS